MADLEAFWHNQNIAVPHLVRLAIVHYQFETIHPFLDGNGRIGRLLMPLYLVGHGLLAKPSLYLSDFFERNRASYYDALMRVRLANDLAQWVRFFLQGVAQTAGKGRDVFRQILSVRTETEQKIMAMGKRASLARQALHLLYQKPILAANDLIQELHISQPTANALLREFVKLGILREVTGASRNRIYSFEAYLELFTK